ncbi:MAG: hypothetical protein H7Y17_13445 [Chlorobia bacterium]|nr:hypothetical protein [Fimbriimonadaceae bacterium]
MSSVSVASNFRSDPRPYRAKWWISSAGYEWKDDLEASESQVQFFPNWDHGSGFAKVNKPRSFFPSETGPWLIAKSEPSVLDEHFHEYDPMTVPGLHRILAELNPSKEPILEFVSRYGFCGSITTRLRAKGTSETDDFFGESLKQWLVVCGSISSLVRLWDLARMRPAAAYRDLSKILELRGSEYSWTPDSPDDEAVRIMRPLLPPNLDEASELSLLAKHTLQLMLNFNLGSSTVPFVEVRPGSQIRLQPKNLGGAIYLHLALEVMGKSVPAERCQACGRWFIPKHGSQIYCRPECKFKGYRQRKKENSNG